jgi:ferric-dicitrate binding protein FerR (iron transport regulator)
VDPRIIILFVKYINDECDANELEEALMMLKNGTYQSELAAAISQVADDDLNGNITSNLTSLEIENIYAGIKQRLHQVDAGPDTFKTRRKIITLWPKISAAAAIALIAAGIFFYTQQKKPDGPGAAVAKNNIVPGANRAFLTLSGGKRISLSDVADGKIAQEDGSSITKTADGQLVYSATGSGREKNSKQNTVSTPKGGKWRIHLPDGTAVWLNAASSITYPASFVGSKVRGVELKGEAYFEVTKDKAHPFIVKADNQEVEVLGTHFNVNSYADEASTKTTLLEGRIRITGAGQQKILKPGEQAILNGKVLKIGAADIETAVAWKNDKFVFRGESIKEIMRVLVRWYNIDVEYRGAVTTEGFQGKIGMQKNITEVLQLLELTRAVHFKIEGRKIIVTK